MSTTNTFPESYGGWISIHRKLLTDTLWENSTPKQKSVLIALLILANSRPKESEWNGRKYEIKRGQLITSLSSLAQKCGKGISVENVRNAIRRFEKLEFVTNKSTSQNRLITIVNYDRYQLNGYENTKKKPMKAQTKDKVKTTTNNINKENNVYNTLFSQLSIEDKSSSQGKEYWKLVDYIIRKLEDVGKMKYPLRYEEFLNLRKNYEFDDIASKLSQLENYKGISKYKSLYRTLLNWLRPKSY